jgi:dynein heavy chain
MSTKRRKGRYGPEDRKDKCVVFIDDFNLPLIEKYDSQPPIEIIR